jgi:hypothetical protein
MATVSEWRVIVGGRILGIYRLCAAVIALLMVRSLFACLLQWRVTGHARNLFHANQYYSLAAIAYMNNWPYVLTDVKLR